MTWDVCFIAINALDALRHYYYSIADHCLLSVEAWGICAYLALLVGRKVGQSWLLVDIHHSGFRGGVKISRQRVHLLSNKSGEFWSPARNYYWKLEWSNWAASSITLLRISKLILHDQRRPNLCAKTEARQSIRSCTHFGPGHLNVSS